MDEKFDELKQAGLLIVAGLTLRLLPDTAGLGDVAASLGLSDKVVENVFGFGSEILVHASFEKLKEFAEYIKASTNRELYDAILYSYREAIAGVETDILNELQINEPKFDALKRIVFKAGNEQHELRQNIQQNLINPLLDILSCDKVIALTLKLNWQAAPEELITAINKGEVHFYDDPAVAMPEGLIQLVVTGFAKHFRAAFLQKIKTSEKARTLYFTTLLENIVRGNTNIQGQLNRIADFMAQANLKPQAILAGDGKMQELQNLLIASQGKIKTTLDEIKESVNNLIAPRLDKRDRKSDLKGSNIYDFKYQYLDFVGRTDEMRRLWNFIGSKSDEQKFLWWMVTGPGGMGKSRIAQKLCLMDEGYYSGFFDFTSTSTLPNWNVWRPELPTLIIIDYALSRMEKVIELITTLKRDSADYDYPVRLLLLDRMETETWTQKLYPGRELEDSLYREAGAPVTSTCIPLAPLNGEDDWKIIRQVAENGNSSKVAEIENSRAAVLTKIEELNPEHRPLFTFFAGIALARGDNIRAWNSDDLLEYTLKHFKKVWRSYITDDALFEKYTWALMVNTFCWGFTAAELEEVLGQYGVNNYRQIENVYSNMTEKAVVNNIEVWLGLQPDILGEFFILKTIQDILQYHPSDGKQIIEDLIRYSWKNNVYSACSFAREISEDFPELTEQLKSTTDIFDILYHQIMEEGAEEDKRFLSSTYSSRNFTKINTELTKLKVQTDTKSILNSDGEIELTVSYDLDSVEDDTLERLKLSRDDFDKPIILDSNNANAFYDRGLLNFIQKLYDGAIVDFNECIRLSPSNYLAYRQRGLTYYSSKKYEEAIRDYDKTIELEPIKLSNSYYQRALAKYDAKSYESSLADINEVIRIDPSFLPAYQQRAIIRISLKDYNGALIDCKHVIQLKPNNHIIYKLRGIAKQNLNDNRGALIDFNKAIEIDPNDFETYYHRAVSYLALTKYKEGMKDIKNTIELNSAFAEAYLVRGLLYRGMGDNKLYGQDFYKALDMGSENALKFRNRPPIPNKPKHSSSRPDRNDVTTVRYVDSHTETGKYKHFKDDIDSGKCVIIS